jgi:hypothetical protein
MGGSRFLNLTPFAPLPVSKGIIAKNADNTGENNNPTKN